MNKKSVLLKLLVIVVCLPILGLAAYCAMQIHSLSEQREEIKKDYADINSIEYGLLSVNIWKDNFKKIASDQIQDFELSDSERTNLQLAISDILKNIIVKTDSIVQNPHNFKGKVRKFAYKTFVNKDEFIKKTPSYSQGIVNEVLKPKNKEKIKHLALERLNQFASQTYGDTADIAHIDSVLAKYHSPGIGAFDNKAEDQVNSLQEQTYNFVFIILGIIALFLLGWIAIGKNTGLQKLFFGISVVLALIVLLVGLTTPMIEIDARIKKMDFVLLGEHLQFVHQVLFYQSKSILQVVAVLVQTKAIDSTVVGVMILIFSIVFPITKLITTQIYLLGGEKTRQNKFVVFFALKSGKWSMADVMVVAIFMAYIGFKGIIDNQLQNVDFNTKALRSISTNLTSTQPAFVLFLSFVIYGIILSEILKRIDRRRKLNAELEKK